MWIEITSIPGSTEKNQQKLLKIWKQQRVDDPVEKKSLGALL